jgi:sugar lactone lactonase YvrE
VVDAAAPDAEKTIPGGPKLVRIGLKTNQVSHVYPFTDAVAGPASYLNDIRIAPDGSFAYLTDSGSPGGLIVVDLATGDAWRMLSGDATTEAERSVLVRIDGKVLRRPDGRAPMFNADGIALSPDGRYLYWQALTGKTLYRIGTNLLQQARANPAIANGKAEKIADTEPADGLWMDKDGRLYLSALGENAVKLLEPNGKIATLITDARLRWPDTFSQGPDGRIYVTASHIQDSPWFHSIGWTDKHFAVFSFMPPPEQPGSASQ